MHDPSGAGSLLVTVADSNTGEYHRILARVSLGVQYYSRFPLLERVLRGHWFDDGRRDYKLRARSMFGL